MRYQYGFGIKRWQQCTYNDTYKCKRAICPFKCIGKVSVVPFINRNIFFIKNCIVTSTDQHTGLSNRLIFTTPFKKFH